MQVDEFKKAVTDIIGVHISFDGHVSSVVNNISEHRQKIILGWIDSCSQGHERPEPCTNSRDMIAFIYKSNDNRIRGILTKKKNSFFIELFLDKHKYYDRKRRYLGL